MPFKNPLMSLALAAATLVVAVPAQADVQQLRIYQVPAENEDVFHERFREKAWPIMKSYGFDIRAMWKSGHEGQTEFVYLLNWPDRETMQTQWEAFMADEDWADIKRETGAQHGTFVLSIEDRILDPTPYSPTFAQDDVTRSTQQGQTE